MALMGVPEYGNGKSERIETILAQQWQDIEEYILGKREGREPTG
jgi:hypothetical protein